LAPILACVGELSESLDWDKGRVSHQLTRMENRGFVKRTQYGADGRRAGIGLTAKGRHAAQDVIVVHPEHPPPLPRLTHARAGIGHPSVEREYGQRHRAARIVVSGRKLS
jgi:DNA-binding MarR family transcriptional regulator